MLRRLHKQLGLLLAVFLVTVSTTGILVNHSEQFGLSENYVPAWIASFYLDNQAIEGISRGDVIFYTIGGTLFADRESIAPCDQLLGHTAFDSQQIALCNGELVVLTDDLQLIERIDESKGLPANVGALWSAGDELLIQSAGEWVAFDLFSLESRAPSALPPTSALPEWQVVPETMLLQEAVTWQQFFLDLHSGAIAGLSGKLFMDLVGIAIILMVVSGFVMWRNTRA